MSFPVLSTERSTTVHFINAQLVWMVVGMCIMNKTNHFFSLFLTVAKKSAKEAAKAKTLYHMYMYMYMYITLCMQLAEVHVYNVYSTDRRIEKETHLTNTIYL